METAEHVPPTPLLGSGQLSQLNQLVRVAVLGSTRGTSSQRLFDLYHPMMPSQTVSQGSDGRNSSVKICIVLSNKEDAPILDRARKHGVPAVFISPKGLKRTTFDRRVSDRLKTEAVDLILLVGYMRILSKDFVEEWKGRIYNVHPSLLPEFAGGMDLEVHRAVLEARKKESGCTIHEVTEEVDSGPIVVQKKCSVLETDTPETLKQRVQALEGPAFEEAITLFLENLKKKSSQTEEQLPAALQN